MKKKLLILTNTIPSYRIPFYNELSKHFDLTIGHYSNKLNKNKVHFLQLNFNRHNLGPFYYVTQDLINIANKYDSIVAISDIRNISYMLLGFNKSRNYSLTYWGIGLSASYKKGFDNDRKFDKIRFYIMNKADSLIFYSKYAYKRYIVDGNFNPEKLFVANNTVSVTKKITVPKIKDHFIFVGTLYKQKKIFSLLKAYKIALDEENNLEPLIIIGSGDQEEKMSSFIKAERLEKKVYLKGAIFDQNVLEKYYKHSIASISPGQAGLSVLNAMAYGVPFVTSDDAITGGEIFNIKNEHNGILYNGKIHTLSKILVDLSRNPNKVYEMSNNAQSYYFNNRKLNTMIEEFKKGILYAQDTFVA